MKTGIYNAEYNYDIPITQRRKRKVTTKSPCSSPHKYWYSQSPLPKSKRQARTGMERACSSSASWEGVHYTRTILSIIGIYEHKRIISHKGFFLTKNQYFNEMNICYKARKNNKKQ